MLKGFGVLVNGQTKSAKGASPSGAGPHGVGYFIREASRDYARALQVEFAELGVTLPQFFYLRLLWSDDGVHQATISQRIGVDRATASFVLTTMEREGMIERRSDASDLRKTRIFLTPTGRRLRAPLLRVADRINRRATRGLPPAEVDRIVDGLKLMIANLRP
jgi:DNA-binding MarR family transcriptional regulator